MAPSSRSSAARPGDVPPSVRRTPGHRAGLALRDVVAEARALVERDGADALTMRALAERLGVAPNALYSHVPDKSFLLDSLLDDLLGDIAVADLETLGWRDGLVELMRRSRRLLLDHAGLLPQFMGRPARGPNAIRLGEATLALLARGGVRDETAVDALRTLLVYTFGFVAMEAPRRADPHPEQRRERGAQAFASAGQPRMAGFADLLSRPANDATFETGLGWILDGVAGTAGGVVR